MSETVNADPFGAEPAGGGAGEDFLVVGLGASAGGVGALRDFFAHVPAESRMAYVVILHLSPEHESLLAEVLQRTAPIPVVRVTGRVRVEPDRAYVVSPNQSLSMEGGQIVVSEVETVEERRAPVDIFFRTLAESLRTRAVCVVLSGTGPDGSMGLKRVKEMGGVAFVQEPHEAEYGDMPRHSLATGLVDCALPVAEIPAKIIGYRDALDLVHVPTAPEERAETDELALRDIFTQLRVRTGHDFSNYKRATVLRRIARRMSVHQLTDLEAFARFMSERPAEANALLGDLLISVTNFFRDSKAFEKLEREIIPRLFGGKGPEDHVRVWVAGCATGEEAYSVAMLLSDFAARTVGAPQIQVFATDIDEGSIAAAREGLYTQSDVADIPPERLSRHFHAEGEGYRVRRAIREMVLFAVHSILKDPPFAHLDLATCRNLLIYLNRAAQKRVMEVLHFALNPGGYLLLGASETTDNAGDLFIPVDKEARIYQSRAVEARMTFPIPEGTLALRLGKLPEALRVREVSPPQRFSYADLHQHLLERYAPPSVVVNEEYEILHMSESAGRYLEIKGGDPTYNLLKLVRPELRLELRAALYQATRERVDVETRDIVVKVGDEMKVVDVQVRPVLRETDAARGFMLVIFKERGAKEEDVRTFSATVNSAEPLARQLEEELMRVKAQLNATVEQHELQREELKASNEELQAANEELRSAAEELETSKEELQSINEELTTVNQELKVKIDELSHAKEDLRNLMDSTEVASVFLDRQSRIKLFTPRARDIFNLIPADVGRPLTDISNRLAGDGLLADVQRVMESLQPVERVVGTTDGRTYLMQLLPYRTSENPVEGASLTFTDITGRKQAEEALRESEARLHLMVDSITDYAIITLDAQGYIETWNEGAERIFGFTQEEAVGQSVEIIFTREDRRRGRPTEEMRQAREEGQASDERWHVRKDGTRVFLSGVLSPNGDRTPTGYVKIARDLTEQKRAEEELRRAYDELEDRVRARTLELAEANEALHDEISERIRTERSRVRLLRQIVRAQEDERRRIARDIHDQLGQQMTALRLNLDSVAQGCGEDEETRRKLEQTQAIAERLDADVDFLAWELRPAALDDLGLLPAIGDFVREWSRHSGVPAEFHTTGMESERLAPEAESALYRITQEALNNAMKYARATRVDVLLERRDQQVVLIVEDDGVGFNPQEAAGDGNGKGLGLIGMRERATLIGGTLEIESAPGEGTTVFARVPVRFLEEGEG